MKKRKLTQIKKLKLKGYYYYFEIARPWIEKYLGLKKGEVIDVTIERPKKVILPISVLRSFKKHFIELKKFSNNRLNSLFSFLRIEKIMREDISQKKAEKIIQEFENKIKKDKGKKFLEDYKLFKKIIFDAEKLKKITREIQDKKLKEEYKIGKEIARHHEVKI